MEYFWNTMGLRISLELHCLRRAGRQGTVESDTHPDRSVQGNTTALGPDTFTCFAKYHYPGGLLEHKVAYTHINTEGAIAWLNGADGWDFREGGKYRDAYLNNGWVVHGR